MTNRLLSRRQMVGLTERNGEKERRKGGFRERERDGLEAVLFSTPAPPPPHTPLLVGFQVVDIIHPGLANVSKADRRGKLAAAYKTTADLVVCFGFRSAFGGGKVCTPVTTGSGLLLGAPAALFVARAEPHRCGLLRACRALALRSSTIAPMP
jgi:ribosomal protein S24E